MITKLLKITGYIFYLLILVEICLQAFYYFSSGAPLFRRLTVPIFRPDKYMVYSVKPHLEFHHRTNEFDSYLYTNSAGFRTSRSHEEYSFHKADSGVFRVLLLGPSFAFGWGVNYEDTFAHYLQNYLWTRGFVGGRKIEVINAGVPGMEAANQLNWFDNYGNEYSPDLVLQFIYGEMLVSDKVATDVTANSDGYVIAANISRAKQIQSLLKNFAVVHYGWVVYTAINSAIGEPAKDRRVLGAGRELNQQTQFDPEEKFTRKALNFYVRLFRSVSAGHARLLIVHFPLSYFIHREDISRWNHLGVVDVDAQIVANEQFCSYLQLRGIPCLNITQDLIGEAKRSRERLYYWLDIHWTPKGNRIAAESVARYLLSQAKSFEAPPYRKGAYPPP